MLALTIICVIITSSLLVRSQSTLFSDLSFQHITNEDFNGVNMDIGWVEFASCKEGCKYSSAHAMCDTDDHSLKYPNGWTQQQMIDIARYAITVKILPSSDIPGSESETTEYAVKSDICSNPIYALNNGYELSFTLDLTTSFVTGFTDLNNWIGSNNAKNRMENSFYPSNINLGAEPRLIIDDDCFYHASGNTDGLHIVISIDGDSDWTDCMYDYTTKVGHDIKIWIGFDKNKAKICQVISSEEYALIATADPTAFPTINPLTIHPSSAPSNAPTSLPTNDPSKLPSTSLPTALPTDLPTNHPSSAPSYKPTHLPTNNPSEIPSLTPSKTITSLPTIHPYVTPTLHPTIDLLVALSTISYTRTATDSPIDEDLKVNDPDIVVLIMWIIVSILLFVSLVVLCYIAIWFYNKRHAQMLASRNTAVQSTDTMTNTVDQQPQIQKVVMSQMAHAQNINRHVVNDIVDQEMGDYANDSDSDSDNDDLWEQHETQNDTQTAGANVTRGEVNEMNHETRG
eukprot:257763_1